MTNTFDASPTQASMSIPGFTNTAMGFGSNTGIGVAGGGLWRTAIAAEVTAMLVVATYLAALLAPPLNLPDWVHQLALTAHLGQPMVGRWDVVGIVACLTIAVGGVLLGAWGVSRRDVTR